MKKLFISAVAAAMAFAPAAPALARVTATNGNWHVTSRLTVRKKVSRNALNREVQAQNLTKGKNYSRSSSFVTDKKAPVMSH